MCKKKPAAISRIGAAAFRGSALKGATDDTGSAFHACVTVCYCNFSIIESKYAVGADLGTTATTGAFEIIET
jgi:hypothetical protein